MRPRVGGPSAPGDSQAVAASFSLAQQALTAAHQRDWRRRLHCRQRYDGPQRVLPDEAWARRLPGQRNPPDIQRIGSIWPHWLGLD